MYYSSSRLSHSSSYSQKGLSSSSKLQVGSGFKELYYSSSDPDKGYSPGILSIISVIVVCKGVVPLARSLLDPPSLSEDSIEVAPSEE